MSAESIDVDCDTLNEIIKMISEREADLRAMKEVRSILEETPGVRKRRQERVDKVLNEALAKNPRALADAIMASGTPPEIYYGSEDRRCRLYDDCRDALNWPGPGWVPTRRGGYRQLGVYDG